MGKLASWQKPMSSFRRFAFLLICSFWVSACVSLPDPETSQDFSADEVGVVSPGHPVGQTFISRRARLDGLTLWLEPDTAGQSLTFQLFLSPQDDQPLFTATVSVNNGATYFEIPPQPDPPHQPYYVQLTATRGEIRVLGRDEDQYEEGTAYLDGQPIEADLAFRATYDYDGGAALADLRGVASHWGLIFPLGILILLPGWLLLDFSGLGGRFDFGEKTALSLGLSLAFVPVLMLWTSTLGLKWGRISVWAGAGVMIGALIWRGVQKLQVASSRLNAQPSTFNQQLSSGLFLILIFAASAFVRIAMVRDLAAPAWVDSVHHAVITRGILEAGGFPPNYLPHIPVENSQYHPGFHSLLAAFVWLSGLDLPKAMLIFGQALNSLMVFPVYLLTKTLTKNRIAGLAAALVAGLFTLMPAYYASWGRYTQLAGLLILPAGFLWLKLIPDHRKDWLPTILLGSLTLAGLFLVHYRVTAFLACLLLANWIAHIHIPMRSFSEKIKKPIAYLGLLGAASLLLALPWLIPTLRDYVIPLAQARSGGAATLTAVNWRYLTPALGVPAMVMAGLGLAWGILRRRRAALTTLVWVTFLFMIANPGAFRLPFPRGFVNQSSVEIMLFLPVSILGGFLIGEIVSGLEQTIPSRWGIAWKSAVLLLGTGAVFLGAQRLLPSLNPVTFLFREADYVAMTWIRENLPPDEVIVLNPTGWGYGLYMGNDGGYWISSLADRQTIPPPVLYGLDKDKREQVNGFVEALLPIGEDAAALRDLLTEYGLRTIYVGGRGGVISPQALANSGWFETLYHAKNTWVFQIQP